MEKQKTPFRIPAWYIPEGVDRDDYIRGIKEQFKKLGYSPREIEIID